LISFLLILVQKLSKKEDLEMVLALCHMITSRSIHFGTAEMVKNRKATTIMSSITQLVQA